MNALWKKLNYKDQSPLYVVNGPDSFEEHLNELPEPTTVARTLDRASTIEFALAFVTRQQEIDHLVPQLVPLLKGDAILWMCYPKGTSKKYRCDFNRDTGWQVLGQYGLEPVRMVAIDEDWSALRFRKATYIKK